MKKAVLVAALLMGSPAALASAESYVVDTEGMHASVNFKVSHLGYSWLTGRFDDFKSEFVFDEDNPSNSSVEVSINTNSINTNHGERDRHLRGKDFLNTKKFPEATFKSTSVTADDDKGEYRVQGELTLHGVTQPVEFDIEQVGAGNDPWGGYRRGFEGELAIKPADFGMNYDVGPLANTVYLEFHLEGVRQ